MPEEPDSAEERFPARQVFMGRRTMVFFAIFFVLGAILPFVLNMTAAGSVHLGWPLPFHHDDGSSHGGSATTVWHVLAADVAIYYAAAAIMGFVGVMRERSRQD